MAGNLTSPSKPGPVGALTDAPADPALSRYEILALLGEGAFGRVYSARDRLLGRAVAIKIAHHADPATTARFFGEAQTLGAIDHPGVVRVLDALKMSDGRAVVVSELVEGPSLARVLGERGSLPLADCREILLHLLDTLAYVHERGIVHRDIKPSNVFVAGGGRVILSDFGVAGALTQHDSVRGAVTFHGQLVGTPRYMAPEQIEGAPQSAETDLWAAAVLFYEMRAGRPLYGGDSLAQVLAKILHESPSFPSELGLDAAAESFLTACLRKDPAAMPRSAREAAALLRVVVAGPDRPSGHHSPPEASSGQPAFAARQGRPAKPEPRPNRRGAMLLWATAALTAAACAAAATYLLWPLPRPDEGALAGGLMVAAGILLIPAGAWLARRLLARAENERALLAVRASELLADARGRDVLNQTLAIEIDRLQERCRSIDERFLTATIVILLQEYQGASSFDDRHKALLGAVGLLEKVTSRIEPWYLKHDQLLSRTLTAVTVAGGLITAVQGARKLLE